MKRLTLKRAMSDAMFGCNFKPTFVDGDIFYCGRDFYNCRYTDSRTIQNDENEYYVHPLGYYGRQVVIACPHCKQAHYHNMSEGWRIPHCTEEQRPPQYYIKCR